mmetsp:Transcript_9243/g.22958  ORF Transcript_9243/g.22958 Transcript_9243/m.22958 type:complete len:310 (-) Transcript_9243:497-1426(-)
MEDTAPIMETEESVFSFSTLVLALITLAVYLLFLKPTAETENTIAATTNTNNPQRTRERQRPRGGRRVATPQQQPQPTRRRQPISENALEVLSSCQSLPPHVASNKSSSIGGFESLSENGLVSFSHTKVAGQKLIDDTAKLQQRKERAKILSRLFSSKDFGKALPAPPSKGSTFVVGISKQRHLVDATQKSSLVRVLKGLSSHYTVLVVVSLDSSAQSSSSSYEPTHKLHSEVVNLLRDEDALPESILPSHRVLLAGSAKGRVALVRQLSTNIGLTVDFDTDVKVELERFGYDVSIVEDWKTILPAETL